MGHKLPSIPHGHRVVKRLANGVAIYWYRSRGGEQLISFRGATLADALRAERDGTCDLYEAYASKAKAMKGHETISGLIALFRESPGGLGSLAPSTRKQWQYLLATVEADLGDMPTKALKSDNVRPLLFEWRDSYARTPRKADQLVQVLARVLGMAVDRGLLAKNPAANIRRIYKVNRSDIIVLPDELSAILSHSTPRSRYIIRFAAVVGPRRGDITSLKWCDVADDYVQFSTNKSSQQMIATVPLFGDAKAVIDELRGERNARLKRGEGVSEYVFLTAQNKPWTDNAVTQAFIRGRDKAGVPKRFHDLRGTAATGMYRSGLDVVEIAMLLGWEEKEVSRIIRRYVSGRALAQGAAAKLKQAA